MELPELVKDDYSMLGQSMLGWIDRRCRQATGISDEVFGGLSIILFVDPGQLPPVADKPLYHSKPTSSVGEQGHLAYLMQGRKLGPSERLGRVTFPFGQGKT